MRFDRESYRKLYVRESAEDRMLPLFARGLRDYLLRHAAEDGTLLSKTKDPAKDLAHALSVHRHELKSFRDGISALIESRFLSFEGGRLWITRFEEAQNARSKGAIRQANYMARKRGQEPSRGDVTDDVTADADETSQLTSPLADETRREIADPPPNPQQASPKIPCPGDLWHRMPEASKATLDTCFIPRWAQEQICKGFAARTVGKRGNERPIDAWVSTVVRVIQAEWADPNKRPRRSAPIEQEASAVRERGYDEILREEAAAEAAARARRAVS